MLWILTEQLNAWTENRDTVKKLSALYKETQDLKYVRAILCILKEFDDDPPKEKDLVKKLTR